MVSISKSSPALMARNERWKRPKKLRSHQTRRLRHSRHFGPQRVKHSLNFLDICFYSTQQRFELGTRTPCLLGSGSQGFTLFIGMAMCRRNCLRSLEIYQWRSRRIDPHSTVKTSLPLLALSAGANSHHVRTAVLSL